MTSFPPELFGAIVQEVRSPSDLLRLRAVSSTLNALATPLAFHSVRFLNTDSSIERFKRLTTYPKFLPLIRKVIYQYAEADSSEPLREYSLRGFNGAAFVEALSLVSRLPALESLVLSIRSQDGPFKADTIATSRDSDFPAEIVLQFLIFRALAEAPGFSSPLKSLIIDRFVPLPHPFLTAPTITALLSTLTHLTLGTTTHCAAFPMTNPRLQWTSSSLFQKNVLSSSLVSLHLHHACVRSAEMLIPASKIHLPRLECLSLQRIYFSDQADVEGFIVRHGGTLIELKLFLCPMALSTQSIPSPTRPTQFRRWAQVWEHFALDLKVLKILVVSEKYDSHGVEDTRLGRYVDNCYICKAVDLGGAVKEQDDTAFEHLLRIVESRSP
ncbi:hypothetical protein F5148DRAFT_1219240 [Russula earlei]|uniref:Uncharacterized protein n=1 Tax=Russula earlei TaxID=71964 RepID=A0ACC0U2H2_9AGAM|nr:hypothetical protein F5148DRAFT_1219240 [Russula earlei]